MAFARCSRRPPTPNLRHRHSYRSVHSNLSRENRGSHNAPHSPSSVMTTDDRPSTATGAEHDADVSDDAMASLGGGGEFGRGPGAPPLLVLTADGQLISRGQLEVAAGGPAALWLQACDSYGNRRPFGGDPLAVQLVPIPTAEPTDTAASALTAERLTERDDGEGSVDISDRGDGTYTAAFSRTRAGDYLACAWLHGQPVPGRVLCRVRPAPLALRRCAIVGDGPPNAICGVRASFTIVTRDVFGNVLASGGVQWAVSFIPAMGPLPTAAAATAAEEAEASVSTDDMGNGMYVVSYTLATPGHFMIHVAMRAAGGATGSADMTAGGIGSGISPQRAASRGVAEPLPGSPFGLQVAPNAVCAPQTLQPQPWFTGPRPQP